MSNSNRSILAARIPIKDKPDHFVEVTVFWDDRNRAEKGYYIRILPLQIEKKNGYEVRSFLAFSGNRTLLETAGRFNAARLQALADDYDTPTYRMLLDPVLAGNGLTMTEDGTIAPLPEIV